MKKLYRVITQNSTTYFVVASSMTEASTFVETMLDEHNYGLSRDRKVISCTLLSEESKIREDTGYCPVGNDLNKLIIL